MDISDEMLYKHAAEARNLWLKTMPQKHEVPEHLFSAQFEQNMEVLFQKQHRRKKIRRILHSLHRIAAAVLVAVMLIFSTAMAIDTTFRQQVIEVIAEVFHDFTEFRFYNNSSALHEADLPNVTFGVLPDGMTKTEEQMRSENIKLFCFKDDTGRFFELTIQQINPGDTAGYILDTEQSDYFLCDINGNQGYCNKTDNNYAVFWTQDDILYNIYGNLELDSLIEIAENLKIS